MTDQGDSEEATSSRDKVLKIFGYLNALNEHRNPAKRRVKEHAWSFWLDELTDHPAVERILGRKTPSDGGGRRNRVGRCKRCLASSTSQVDSVLDASC